MKTTIRQCTVIAFAAGILLAAGAAFAVDRVTYHGFLAGADSTPVDGTVQMWAALYATPAGGFALWSNAATVDVDEGRFTVVFEGFNPDLFENPLYLGIAIGADPEMTPRRLLTRVPIAAHTRVADEAAPGAITGEMLGAGAISPAKLGLECAAGQIIRKIATGWDCGAAP